MAMTIPQGTKKAFQEAWKGFLKGAFYHETLVLIGIIYDR